MVKINELQLHATMYTGLRNTILRGEKSKRHKLPLPVPFSQNSR